MRSGRPRTRRSSALWAFQMFGIASRKSSPIASRKARQTWWQWHRRKKGPRNTPENTHLRASCKRSPRVGPNDPSASFPYENFPPAKAHLKRRHPKFCCQYRHLQTTPRPTSLMATRPVFAHLKRLSLDERASTPSTHEHPQSLTFGWGSPSRRTLTKQYRRAQPRE